MIDREKQIKEIRRKTNHALEQMGAEVIPWPTSRMDRLGMRPRVVLSDTDSYQFNVVRPTGKDEFYLDCEGWHTDNPAWRAGCSVISFDRTQLAALRDQINELLARGEE